MERAHLAAIEVEQLRAGYGRTVVLEGIDLAVAAGEFVAILGSSGCGNYLGPLFEMTHRGVRVVSVGTGPGDARSQKIYEKLAAQKSAGTTAWDLDDIDIGKLVSRETAANALGADVSGYVMPMFHSQTALAYNPDLTNDVPGSYADLTEWVKKNPRKFGYNGIKGGMSGVAFVTGWVYAFSGNAEQMIKGPYDAATGAAWDGLLGKLKDFNKNVIITPGNAGTLDMLNRGEIAVGPVWVDMFYTWKADGKLPPSMKLKLITPGMPGQPMYYVVPAKAAHAKLAEVFVAMATSPEVQAEGIIKRFNWYPGIDAKYLEGKLDKAAWNKLFTDISPDELAAKAQPFPITPYFNDVLESYEKRVAN